MKCYTILAAAISWDIKLLGLIILVVFFSGLLGFILMIKPKRLFKIQNYYFTYTLVIIYICYNFSFYFILRCLRWGQNIDIKLIYNHFLTLFRNHSMIQNILQLELILIFIICFFILLFQLRTMIIKEVYKFHLYETNKHIENEQKESFYSKFMHRFARRYGFDALHRHVNLFFHSMIYRFLSKFVGKSRKLNESIGYYFLYDKFKNLLRYLPVVILILLLLYECYFNNFILHLIFYYLPFYIFVLFYFRISDLVDRRCFTFDLIIFERYYRSDILYVNLTKEEETQLILYINNGFRLLLSQFKNDRSSIMIRSRFEKMTLTDEKGNAVASIFGQQSTALYFYEKDLIVIDGPYFTMYYVKDEITEDLEDI